MANEQNLRPVHSSEEAKERGRAGGIASAKARRRRRTLRDIARAIAEEEITIPKPDGKKEKVSFDVAMVYKQYQQAIMDGDTQSARFIGELLGELKLNVALDTAGITVNVKNEEERRLIDDITNREQ
jgi:hypothetical protein